MAIGTVYNKHTFTGPPPPPVSRVSSGSDSLREKEMEEQM
jgi:hypothetical protein